MKFSLSLLLCMLSLCLVSCLCACDRTPAGEEQSATAPDPQTTDGVTEAPTEAGTVADTETTEPETAPPPYTLTDAEGKDGLDFVIDFPAGEDLVILQITDTQMQAVKGARNATRRAQISNAFFANGLGRSHTQRVWRYTDEAVERTRPDLIVLTGDNIYGELDDSGEMWLELIEKMDSYGIPWCVVFGNHDNESGKGVRWQIEQLEKSEYCIFRQGSVSGNSNYNLLIRQGGEAKYLLYMLDSNGCKVIPSNPGEGMMPDNPDIDLIVQDGGFRNDQIVWMRNSGKSIRKAYGEVPSLFFFHIPDYTAWKLTKEIYGDRMESFPFIPDREGDMGMSLESLGGYDNGRFWDYAKELDCIGMFVGHQHKVATSILCDGIRVTYGLKAGTYDYHSEELLGSTKIILSEESGEMTVEYVHTELPYKP